VSVVVGVSVAVVMEDAAKNAEIKQLKETVSSSSIKAMIKELLKIKELINLLVSF